MHLAAALHSSLPSRPLTSLQGPSTSTGAGNMDPRTASLRAEIEREFEGYKKIQGDIQKSIQTRTQLHSQQVENENVLEELSRLDEDANVFKLIGPALIKQDLIEAKSNVSKRIEYIKGELDRVDGHIKSLESKNKDKEQELMKLEKRMQTLPAAS